MSLTERADQVFKWHREITRAGMRPLASTGTPAAFLVIIAWSLVYTLIHRPWESLAGLGLCALGIPFYYVFQRKAR